MLIRKHKDLVRVMKLADKCGLEAWQAKRLGTWYPSSWQGQLPSPTISTDTLSITTYILHIQIPLQVT